MGKTANGDYRNGDRDFHACQTRALPARLHQKAAEVAARINPVNAPLREMRSAGLQVDSPAHLTLLTTKYWGPSPRQFPVSFVENDTPADLKARILSHMNAWS